MSLHLLLEYLTSKDFLRGAALTLLLTVVSLGFGMLIGLMLALLQSTRSRVAKTFTFFYLWLFRGTPVLFQIIFIYNVLPSFAASSSNPIPGSPNANYGTLAAQQDADKRAAQDIAQRIQFDLNAYFAKK